MRCLCVIVLTFAGGMGTDLGLGLFFCKLWLQRSAIKLIEGFIILSLSLSFCMHPAIFGPIKLEQNSHMIRKSQFKSIHSFFKEEKKGGRYTSQMKTKVYSLVLQAEMVLNFCLFPKAETTIKGPNLAIQQKQFKRSILKTF